MNFNFQRSAPQHVVWISLSVYHCCVVQSEFLDLLNFLKINLKWLDSHLGLVPLSPTRKKAKNIKATKPTQVAQLLDLLLSGNYISSQFIDALTITTRIKVREQCRLHYFYSRQMFLKHYRGPLFWLRTVL